MASIQCQKPATEACQQNCHKPRSNQSSSLGQKVSEMASFLKGGCHRMHGQPHTTTHTTTQCYSQTITYKTSAQGLGPPKHQAGSSNGVMASHGKTKKTMGGEHKIRERDHINLFQKIKDGISSDSSCSDSGESDSDHEGNRRKNKVISDWLI